MKYERVYIEAIGYELAPVVVTSAEIEDRLAPLYRSLRIQPGQLETITGIVERRFWEEGDSLSRGAAAAAMAALDHTDLESSELGALVYTGVCRENFEPATACHVAAALESAGHPIAPDAAVFDLSNACLGVLNGILDVANRIELGQIKAGMVVSCESAREIVEQTVTSMLAQRDMANFRTSLATLTGGSGAVAVIVRACEPGEAPGRRLVGGVMAAAPRYHDLCRWGMEPARGTLAEGRTEPLFRQFMATDSTAVLEHGVTLGKRTWACFLEELGWSADSVDRTVCHQVGRAHRDAILGALEIPSHKDYIAYEHLGNTGTVALPLAAALAEERDELRAGQRVAWLGIGSGLNCLMLGLEW
ncbi:MAG: 3-oxoacyl-[acyl-carrier-protein] synthase III [Pseudohongiellaceae bacterium]